MAYQETLPKDTLLLDEFRIVGLLGTGGFANTYLAHDSSLGREVAIKEYFPSELAIRVPASQRVEFKSAAHEAQFDWALRRFVREAQTLAKFRHPSVVRVFRVFKANNTAYMVLEFIHGSDMDTWLKQIARPTTQEELDTLLPPLLDALDVVHAAGILHRDIKPANIYLRASDQQPVLLDFGAARFASGGEFASKTAAIVSKGYSPSEAYSTDSQLQGPWTDIYGMAATVYRSISGKPPPEATMRALDDRCLSATRLPAAASYRPDFLRALDRALAVMPKDRPQSIREWRQELLPDSQSAPRVQSTAADATTAVAWRPISHPSSNSDPSSDKDEVPTRHPGSERLASVPSRESAREPQSSPEPRASGTPRSASGSRRATSTPASVGSRRTLAIGLVLFVLGGVALAVGWRSSRSSVPDSGPSDVMTPPLQRTTPAEDQARDRDAAEQRERALGEAKRREEEIARAAADRQKREQTEAKQRAEERARANAATEAELSEDEARAKAWADRKAREDFISERQKSGRSQ